MGLDGAVAGGVGDAGQHETSFDLVVVQEALVGLVDGASGDLAGAGGAGSSAAGVGEVDACSSAASRMYWSSGTSMVLFRPSLSETRVTL